MGGATPVRDGLRYRRPVSSVPRLPWVSLMKRLLFGCAAFGATLAVLSFAGHAHAGEPNALGCIFVADGGSENNATTGYNVANQNVRAFDLGTNQPITLQCMRGPCNVAVGDIATDAGRGLWMAANEKITSSLGAQAKTTLKGDAGVYTGGIVSVVQGAGATAAELCVFSRNGNE